MSGGGKKTPTNTTAAKTAAPVLPVQTQTFQSFLPNEQQGLLAQQMAAGGYGNEAANQGILGNLYRDVVMPMISRPDQIEQYVRQLGLTPASAGTAGLTGNPRLDYNANQPAPAAPTTRTPYGNRDQNYARTS